MKKTTNFFKNYWPLLGYVLISVIFLFPILRQQGIPFKYDWNWPLFEMKEFWKYLFDSGSLGLFSAPGKYAILILGLPDLVKLPPSLALKIFLVSIHTLAGYGFYIFLSKRIESKAVAFAAGLAYAFSPYIFIRTITGFTYSIVAYAVLPVFLLIYFQPKKNYFTWVSLAFLFSLISSQIQAGILLPMFLIVNALVVPKWQAIKIKVRNLLALAISAIIINLPWLIYLRLHKINVAVVSGNAATTMGYMSLVPHSLRNMLMLSDHQVTSPYFYPLSHDKLFLSGWLIVWFVAFCAVFNKANRQLIWTFIISSVLVLPFIKGPLGVFGKFYIWFYNHIPQIAVFRETYHFEFLYAISLCVLFAFGLDWLWLKITALKIKLKNETLNSSLKTGAKTFLAGSVLFIIMPYFTFNYAGYFKLQRIPPEYYQLHSFFQENKDYCHKIYYPPGLGFIYFKGDDAPDASNSDVIARSLDIPYLDDGTTYSYLPSDEGFLRNEIVSQYYEKNDNGEFAYLLNEGNIDCVVLKLDTDTKYYQASNLGKARDPAIIWKWRNTDFLALIESKKGLRLERKFGDNIYIYKIETTQIIHTEETQIENIPNGVQLPITDWATSFAYYKDGWSRGRYDFWRKHLFTQLRQDFIYTAKKDAMLSGQISESGDYDLVIRYLDGDSPGKFEIRISKFETIIEKKSNEEKFIVKDLAKISVKKGDKVEIKNISGENAIADIVLAPGD